MSANTYKYVSIVLAVIVVGLLAYIFTRPKPIDTVALRQDLAQFSAEVQQWNTQYSEHPTVQGEQQLSQYLSAFAQKLQTYQ